VAAGARFGSRGAVRLSEIGEFDGRITDSWPPRACAPCPVRLRSG